MRGIVSILCCVVFAITLVVGCEKSYERDKTKSDNTDSVDIENTSTPSNDHIPSLDFSPILNSELDDDKTAVNVENIQPWVFFELEKIGRITYDYIGNVVDPDADALKITGIDSESRVPGNGGITFIIGEKSWNDYSLSFDCYLGESNTISFVMYMETRLTNIPDDLNIEGDYQFYWFTIDNSGNLNISTTFGYGGYHVMNMNNFDTTVWNHIELIQNGNELALYLNGIFIIAVCSIDEHASGRVGFSGGTGSMFRNINIKRT
ncbi:MAG: DUF1080 domain-containing protein [Oscillospiraceae bacterium]|nr:DUF1080 domain-containing protein [Oscillospiraceae bacterium]